MNYLSVGDVAERLGVRPAHITGLFYRRDLSAERCPIVAGRRLIPPDYVEVIAMALGRKGVKGHQGDVTDGGAR